MTTESATDFQMDVPEPQAQHRWLQRFLGEWKWSSDDASGTETGRALGELWISVHGDGERPGAGGIRDLTQLTLGFDPNTGRFVGSWVGSMMTHHWLYEGELAGNTLTLTAEGPAFDGSDRMQAYRDVHEFTDDNRRTLKAFVQQDDGSWEHFMTTEYVRA